MATGYTSVQQAFQAVAGLIAAVEELGPVGVEIAVAARKWLDAAVGGVGCRITRLAT